MKVFFIINSIPPDYGGGYLRVFRTASRFKEYGWFYKIATYTKRDVYKQYLNVKDEDVVFLKESLFWRFFELPWRMLFHSKDYDALYIASARWYTVLPTFVAKLQGKKVVNSVTLSMVDSPALPPSNIIKAPFYYYKNIQFKFADYVFVNSPLLVEECKNCGLDESKIKLVNNPVNTDVFHPVEYDAKRSMRKEYGLHEDKLTILFVGSINKRKGCDLLPVIFSRFFSNCRVSVNFVICGQKGYPETDGILNDLQKLFKENDSVLLIREAEKDPSVFYQLADFFLFPTTNEGMPNVVLEAMACGCMIKCNLLPGITDYVLDDVFLVHNNNVNEYVDSICNYINNRKKYEEYIKKNIEVIEASFSVASVDGHIKSLLA